MRVKPDSSVRDGYDPAVRPQDDLFGHVNGRWYDTVEIPADLPGFGQFVEPAAAVRAAGR